jgi:hypothetical protein
MALAASIGLLAWTGFGGLILAAPAIVLLVLVVRVSPLIGAIERVRSARQKAIDDAAQVKTNFEAIRDDLSAAADREQRGELSEAEQKRYRAKAETIIKELDDVEAEIDKLTASTDWTIVTQPPPEARAFRSAMSWFDRVPVWPGAVIAILLGVFEILFLPDWPAPIIALATPLVLVATFLWTRQHSLSIPAVAIAVVAVMLLSAAATAVTGRVDAGVVNVSFVNGAGSKDGQYVLLGEADGHLYLNPCATRTVIVASEAEVLRYQLASEQPIPHGPSLWDVITARRQPIIGYRPDC